MLFFIETAEGFLRLVMTGRAWKSLSSIPMQDDALPPALAKNDLHINNVTVNEHGILISGTRIDALLTSEG